MRSFISGFFKTMGIVSFLAIIALAASLYWLKNRGVPSLNSQDNAILTFTLGDENFPQHYQPGNFMSVLDGQPLTIHAVIEGIREAAKDNRIKGILITLAGDNLKTASTQEIRNALKEFKSTGKFIYSYSDSFGELSNGTMSFYLASISTKIWLMPLGQFNYTGMMIEIPFAKKALENLKVRPQMAHREEYKGAIESLTESDFTIPYKQNLQKIYDAVTLQILTDIAADRKIETGNLRTMMNEGAFLPRDAVEKKLIDVAGYMDEVKDDIEKLVSAKPKYYPFEAYLQTLKADDKGQQIAVIYAEGEIMNGRVARNLLSNSVPMDSREIARAIREAAEDETIKAIVMRIDSVGGSPIGSAIIGREVEKAKLKKPFIVSMANYAASGGYWIACNAHKIVAQPGTITGSIGIFAGKIVTEGFWEQYGIHWGEVHSGESATLWSSGKEFTHKGWGVLNAYVDNIYDTFLNKVSAGRNMDRKQVHSLAKGQIWTGQEAVNNGLVDVLGGLDTAIEIAKKEAGMAINDPVTLVHLPAAKSIMEIIINRGNSPESSMLTRYPALGALLEKTEALLTATRFKLKADNLGMK